MTVYSSARIKEDAKKIRQCLSAFGISSEVIKTQKTPASIEFTIKLNSKKDIRRARSLSQELAMILASVKGYVGIGILDRRQKLIELILPHEDGLVIPLTRFLKSKKYLNSQKILFPIGVNYKNEIIAKSIEEMPNLLITGIEGLWPTVFLPCFLLSLAKKVKPREAKVLLIDPFLHDLCLFEDLPHLLKPPITEVKEALENLELMIEEIKKRREANTKKPKIIIVIDHFDVLSRSFKMSKKYVSKIAKDGPEVGIYIYISENILFKNTYSCEMIKAFDSKISFASGYFKEYRHFLGEKRIRGSGGQSSMLFKYKKEKIERLQGFNISEKEIKKEVKQLNLKKEVK